MIMPSIPTRIRRHIISSDDQMTEAKARLEEIALATKTNDATIAANSYWDVKDYSAYYENGVLSR